MHASIVAPPRSVAGVRYTARSGDLLGSKCETVLLRERRNGRQFLSSNLLPRIAHVVARTQNGWMGRLPRTRMKFMALEWNETDDILASETCEEGLNFLAYVIR